MIRRLSLYGLLVRAQRLSSCWDSAGQLMSSRYVARVMISDFIYPISRHWTIALFIFIFIQLALIKSTIPYLQSQSQVLSRIYPTNIITGFPVFFFLYVGHQGRTFPIACHVMLPSIITLSSLLFYYPAIATKHSKEESILRIFLCAYVRPDLHTVNPLTRHTLNRRLERVGFRYDAIVLVLGTLSDERRRLRHEP